MNIRIGHGYDVHRFSDEISPGARQVIALGGIEVPCEYSLLAHSDGDLLIHALCDAILGGLGAGDIGKHFPDTDEKYHNIDSTELLQQVIVMATLDNWQLVNADITVVAQAPRLAPYIDSMKDRLSDLMVVDRSCVNIKATTTEGLGFTGRKEGIACYAVVLLGKPDS